MAQRNDIEDVLSSIRRLVAEEAPQAERSAQPAPRGSALPALMLEPARRVVDPEDPFQMVAPQQAPAGPDPDPAPEQRAGAPTRSRRHASGSMARLEANADVPAPLDGFEFEPGWRPGARPTEPRQDVGSGAETEQAEAQLAVETMDEAPRAIVAAAQPGASAEAGAPLLDDPKRRGGARPAIDLADLSERLGGDEALRELIAEVVRQELAGALGERITRNVRKLVRRELRQALSGGEFD